MRSDENYSWIVGLYHDLMKSVSEEGWIGRDLKTFVLEERCVRDLMKFVLGERGAVIG